MQTSSLYPPSLRFLDKVLLQPRRKGLRGVEVFNLHLLRDLEAQGLQVRVAAHPTWRDTLMAAAAPAAEAERRLMFSPAPTASLLLNGLLALRGGARGTDEILLLANVANGLIPALWWLRMCRPSTRIVLIAHRDPTRRFLRALPRARTTVLAVNGLIAAHFREAGFPEAQVYYGVTQADRFSPRLTAADTDAVHFCLLGNLDTPWKGADTALAAFRLLPTDILRRCVLHLAAYRQPPVFDTPHIRTYGWMAYDAIPDFLRRMDVMVVPSRDEREMRETFSQAMVQGMLTGLPILASALPVLTEKLETGGGRVFHTPAELAEQMAQLVRDTELRRTLGAQARRIALARYVWDTRVFVERFLGPV